MKRLLLTAGFGALLASGPALAQFTTFPIPTGPYTSGTTVMTIPGANFSSTSTLTDGAQTLTFSTALSVRTVPGGGWATWNSPPATESATPKVLYSTQTTQTITLSSPSATFGFELEPNAGTIPTTVTYFNGSTTLGTISRTVVGTSGALLFAASSATPVTSVQVSCPGGSGFAMAQFRYGNGQGAFGVPALSTYALLALAGTLLLGGWWRLRSA